MASESRRLGILSGSPSRGAPEFVVSLDGRDEAVLEVFDVMGRQRERRDLSHLGPGQHVVRWDASRPLEPGIYFARLSRQQGRDFAKVVVIE